MTDWIDINLPWNTDYISMEQSEYLDPPDLDTEMKEVFGYTEEELGREYFGADWPNWISSKLYDAFYKQSRKIDAEVYMDLSFDSKTRPAEVDKRLRALNNKSVNKVLDFYAKLKPLNKWIDSHPATKLWNDKNEAIRITFEEKQRQEAKSFTGRGLAKAGVLMEIKSGETTKQILIGHINELGGSCDDCRGISDTDLVVRYKILWWPS